MGYWRFSVQRLQINRVSLARQTATGCQQFQSATACLLAFEAPLMSTKETTLELLFLGARVVPRRQFLASGVALLSVGHTTNASARITDEDRKHMRQAIELMRKAGVVDKTGGPFGCVIVRNGEVLSEAGNSVLRDNDPSAHAEVNAIREACKKVSAPHINGATMYTSGEPCPMCYAAAYWARVGKIYYAAAWSDFNDLFDDTRISLDMKKPYARRSIPVEPLLRSEAQKVWLEFRKLPDRGKY
jgi:guanine deaminase